MTFPQVATVLVLMGSTAAFLSATSVLPARWSSPTRWGVRLAIVVLMAAIAILEVPLTPLPFWSRDFSLTWLSMVVALGLIAAFPRRIPPPTVHSLIGGNGAGDACDRSAPRASNAEVTGEPDTAARPAPPIRDHRAPVLLVMAIVTLSLILYVICAERNLVHVNTDMGTTDQSAYLNYAYGMQESGFARLGNRNRMPVYPFLLALTIGRGGPSEVTFQQGKTVSLVLSVVLLVGCGMILRRYFDLRWTLLLTEIAAWSLFVIKAPYVQPELLYYTLTFALIVMAVELLARPSPWMACAIGIVGGVAHLTKASILPCLVLLMAAMLVRAILAGAGTEGTTRAARPRVRLWASTLRYPFLIACFFLLTVFPYIKNSWHGFGHWFYNVNSTFYIWYDSWEEAKAGTAAHGDRVGWPDMPAEQIPSLAKYVREHSLAQMADRILSNARGTLATAAGSFGYLKYSALLALSAIAAAGLNTGQAKAVWRTQPALVLYLLGFFAAYAILYSWFRPIVAYSNRLVLALYLPFLFTGARAVHFCISDRFFALGKLKLRVTDALFLALSMFLLSDVWAVLVDRSLHTYGGS